MMYFSPQGKKGGCMGMVPACRYALFICDIVSNCVSFRIKDRKYEEYISCVSISIVLYVHSGFRIETLLNYAPPPI